MNQSLRRAAIGIPGFCAFLNLYAPQSLLPTLAREFGATPADISLTMTATALAIAITAPFAGAIADVLGRKRVIVAAMILLTIPTALIALSPNLHALIAWRFAQGLVLPPIFTVVVAYIGEEWPSAEATAVTGVYMSAISLGGFSGRFFAGLLADTIGWRSGFIVFAAVTFACAAAVGLLLPQERNFTRSEGLASSARQMLDHLRNPRLLAIYVIGFGTLFNFVAMFTYVNFLLAAPPFNLSATWLGAIFVTYLAGGFAVLWLGRAVTRFGRRTLILGTIAVWMCGALLTLVPSLWTIIAGLAVVAACGFITQATSTAFVALTAESGRTSAIGLYATSFYVGGGVGAVLPGLTWNAGGWPTCVAMVIAMQIFMATMIWFGWKR
ncbi:MAG: transporter, family, putative rane transport protein [Hyphomicrobiales bacterium]|nr:transporter, family, putative rane transport protein [Hyphomicrobiales bacterium]